MHLPRTCSCIPLALTTLTLVAGPASPDLLVITQPDGRTFRARIMGDEFRSWVETEEGYTVLQHPVSRVWEYARPAQMEGELISSGVAVQPDVARPQDLRPHLRPALRQEALDRHLEALRTVLPLSAEGSAPESAAPVTGNKRLLIILVSFSDRAIQTSPANWGTAIFGTGTGVKSVRQFYKDNSFNNVDILPLAHTQPGNPQGIISVTLSTAHPNYGKNYDMAMESAWLNAALTQAAPFLDANAMDTDGNGKIAPSETVVYFIPAGYDTSGSSKTPSIWAHAWGSSTSVKLGTKILTNWAMNGELNNYDRQHPFGVITHELGHAMFSLPDLYDTSYTNSGLGAFSLMASGSWGRDTGEDGGATPVSLDAWCRQRLGWTQMQTLPPHGTTFNLNRCLLDGTSGLKLQNPLVSSQDYFLVENRHPMGWDRGLVGLLGTSYKGGALVIHVDDAINGNAYSANSHQMVLAVHADGAAAGTRGTGTSFFMKGGSADSFTPLTTPAAKTYGNIALGQGFTAASAPADTMTFNSYLESVLVSPATATVVTGCPVSLTATHSLGAGTFTWSLAGVTFSPTTTASGAATQFLAPTTAGSYAVTATSSQAGLAPATCSLTTLAPSSVKLALTTPVTLMAPGQVANLSLSLSGAPMPPMTWTTSGGTLAATSDAGASWTAPATRGRYTVTATSVHNPALTTSVAIDVVPPTAVQLTPDTATLVSGGSLGLTASTPSGGITWTFTGQGTLAQTSTASGVLNRFTAPTGLKQEQTVVVTATNSTDATQKATATLTLKTFDINQDGTFDLLDILALAQDWGTPASRSRLSGGTTAGLADLNLLLASLGL